MSTACHLCFWIVTYQRSHSMKALEDHPDKEGGSGDPKCVIYYTVWRCEMKIHCNENTIWRFKGAPCRVRLLRCNVTVPWWSWDHPDMATAGHWWVSPVVSGLKRVADHLSATVKQLHLSDLKGIICTTASKNGSYKTWLAFRWTLPLLNFFLQIFV